MISGIGGGMFGMGNGFDYMIMESDTQSDKVIETFKGLVEDGYTGDILGTAYQIAGVDPSDLTHRDREKIRKVTETYL